jgi:Ras-related protein Rab-2A
VITDKTLSYHDSLFKIIIIGDSGIGKSCVLKRLVENEFKDDHDVTVGVEFGSYLVRVQDKVLKLQIWDTAGQESFRSITKIFYRGAHAAILAYSVGRRDSFDSLNDWLKEIKNSCAPDVQVFLIGNKSDLNPMQREVTIEEALEFQKKHSILYFTETSAKSGDNIDRLFLDCSKFIYLKYKDQLHKMIEDETASQTSSNTRALQA